MENKILAAYAFTATAIALALGTIFVLYSQFFSGVAISSPGIFDNVLMFFKNVITLVFAFAIYHLAKDVLKTQKEKLLVTPATVKPLTLSLIALSVYYILDLVQYILLGIGVLKQITYENVYYSVPTVNLVSVLISLIVIALLSYFVLALLKVQKGITITISNKISKLPATTFSKVSGVILSLIAFGILALFLTVAISVFSAPSYSTDLDPLMNNITFSLQYLGTSLLGLAVLMSSSKLISSSVVKITKLNSWVYFAGAGIFALGSSLYVLFSILAPILNLPWYGFNNYSAGPFSDLYAVERILIGLALIIALISLTVLMWKVKAEDKYVQIV